jgi:hypothetical protein
MFYPFDLDSFPHLRHFWHSYYTFYPNHDIVKYPFAGAIIPNPVTDVSVRNVGLSSAAVPEHTPPAVTVLSAYTEDVIASDVYLV